MLRDIIYLDLMLSPPSVPDVQARATFGDIYHCGCLFCDIGHNGVFKHHKPVLAVLFNADVGREVKVSMPAGVTRSIS